MPADEVDRKADGDKRAEVARKREAWRSLVLSVGRRYEACRLETFEVGNEEQRAILASLRAYADNVDRHVKAGDNIVLFGPPGTGKDHLAIGVAYVAIGRGFSVAWFDGQSLYQEFRDNIGGDRPERDIIARATRPDILLLSDPVPPRGELTDYQATILWRVVDRRYRDMRPMWITLNVASGQEASARLGAGIVDRLRDGATYGWCGWGSYRKPGSERDR